MKKLLPIISLLLVVLAGVYVVNLDSEQKGDSVVEKANKKIEQNIKLASFDKRKSCAKRPKFLKSFKIKSAVMIDLSQRSAKGVSLLFGKDFRKFLHSPKWERFGYFGTYTLDIDGNIYLVPMPFVSIEKDTFEYQKNLYILDSSSAKLDIFMSFDDVNASNSNPYGLSAIAYDCKSDRFYISAIDSSTYDRANGRIYVVDRKSKKVIDKIDGFDALALTIVEDEKGARYLLAGSARDDALYSYEITQDGLSQDRVKLLNVPTATQHIRKIRVKSKDILELETIEFSYSLIASSDDSGKYREHYLAKYNSLAKSFEVSKIQP